MSVRRESRSFPQLSCLDVSPVTSHYSWFALSPSSRGKDQKALGGRSFPGTSE